VEHHYLKLQKPEAFGYHFLAALFRAFIVLSILAFSKDALRNSAPLLVAFQATE
jgi:hypothetical protein